MQYKINKEIEAVKWTGDNLDEVRALNKDDDDSVTYKPHLMESGSLYIYDDESGTQFPSIGSYVIKIPHGGLMCMSEESFKAFVGEK